MICAFQDDVYQMGPVFGGAAEFAVLQTKDYISRPKENGYRSYHLILGILDGPGKGMTVDQLRTIAIDCWASLEHQIKYKRRVPHEHLIREELKRCADEIASVGTCPWRPSGSCSTGPEPAAEKTPRRNPSSPGGFGYGIVWAKAAGGRDAPLIGRAGRGGGLLGQKTFLGALGDGIPRPEVAQQGGGGVVVPVVLGPFVGVLLA